MNGIFDPEGKNLNPITNKVYSKNYLSHASKWSKFPVYDQAAEITKSICGPDQLCYIKAGTGSGKTCLVPKFALHSLNYNGLVIVCLPKRKITEAAANYAAQTLDVNLGEYVNYKYKGSYTHVNSKIRLLYVTEGVLTNYMTNIIKNFNKNKLQNTIIIMDEIHELKPETEINLLILKNLLTKVPSLKAILMSADADINIFRKYFSTFNMREFDIPGTSPFPVETTTQITFDRIPTVSSIIKDHLEDDHKTSILFFVASVAETKSIKKELCKTFKSIPIIALYAESADFDMLKNDTQKIIVATNVAESSLTIQNLGLVIDSGQEIKKVYCPETNLHTIQRNFISYAQRLQRKGRTGRTCPGQFICLYNESRITQDYPIASVQTQDITSNILKLCELIYLQKSMESITTVINNLISPINSSLVKSYLKRLRDLNMIDDHDKITPIGRFANSVCLKPAEAYALVIGYKQGCLYEINLIITGAEYLKYNLSLIYKNSFNKLRGNDHLDLLNILTNEKNQPNIYMDKVQNIKNLAAETFHQIKQNLHEVQFSESEIVQFDNQDENILFVLKQSLEVIENQIVSEKVEVKTGFVLYNFTTNLSN